MRSSKYLAGLVVRAVAVVAVAPAIIVGCGGGDAGQVETVPGAAASDQVAAPTPETVTVETVMSAETIADETSVTDEPSGTGDGPVAEVVPTIAADFPKYSLNLLAATAEAIVVVRVSDVSAPRWNSEDGAEWKQTADPATTPVVLTQPYQHRIATVELVEVIATRSPLEVTVGQKLEVSLRGSGRVEPIDGTYVLGWSEAERSSDGGYLSLNQISGTVDPGFEYLLFLRRGSIPLNSGAEIPTIVLVGNYQGKWKLDNGAAVSDLPARTVADAAALFEAITFELGRGVLPPAEFTDSQRIHPLGEPAS